MGQRIYLVLRGATRPEAIAVHAISSISTAGRAFRTHSIWHKLSPAAETTINYNLAGYTMSIPPPNIHDEIRRRIHETLRPKLISRRLLNRMKVGSSERIHVIFELNNEFPEGVELARQHVEDAIRAVAPTSMDRNLPGARHPFVFAELTPDDIYKVIERDSYTARAIEPKPPQGPVNPEPVVPKQSRAIFKVWESTTIRPLTNVSIRTVKADAAQSAFAAFGQGITWAVLDSGIQKDHPHFQRYDNLTLPPPLAHKTFAPTPAGGATLDPCQDGFGHGTHVAGIIAGAAAPNPRAARQAVGERGRNVSMTLRHLMS
jgi:subtilisin family serine protease